MTTAVSAAGTLPAIIRNDECLYEGDLIHYFRIVFTKAQNLNKPYHNFRHMMHTTFLCHQACIFYRGAMTPYDMRALLIAALFHDFDHCGMRGNDDLNIERALRAMKLHLVARDKPLAGRIETIIRATQYPHLVGPQFEDNLASQIIRDADLAQSLSVAWLQQVVFGLAAEWNQSPLEVLRSEVAFTEDIRFSTAWAKTMFPPEAINAKAKEAEELLALLEGL